MGKKEIIQSWNLNFRRLLNSNIGRESLSSIVLKFSSVGLVFISTVLLARLLGPADYGIYSYIYAIISLLSIPSEFGLPTLVVRETASSMVRKDYSAVHGIWNWSGKTIGIISFILLGLTGIIAWVLRESLAGRRFETFIVALALVPLIALGDLRGAALRGLNKIITGQLPEFLLRPGFFVLFLVGVELFHYKAISAPIAMLLFVVASALAFGIGAWLLRRATPDLVQKAPFHFENRSWLLSALPLAFIGGMQLINNQASIIIQGFYLPDPAIGIFRVATQVSNLASFGLLAINIVVAPRFASLYTLGEKRKLQKLVTYSARVILVFNLLLTIGFVLVGKVFLQKIFGVSYESAYIPLLIMLVGQLVNSFTGSVGMLLNMTNHERETAKGITVAAALNIIFNFLLIPKWGIIGSSIATSISLITWNIILWWVVRKKLKINSLAFFPAPKSE